MELSQLATYVGTCAHDAPAPEPVPLDWMCVLS